MSKEIPRGLYFITDSRYCNLFTQVDVAVKNGVKIIQYRDKDISKNKFLENSRKIREMTKDVLLIINDYADIAVEVGSDGVHIGQKDIAIEEARGIVGNKMILGVSVSNTDEAQIAYEKGADYLGVGPLFSTETKKDWQSLVSLEELRKIKSNVKIPIVAIGGINPLNARLILSMNVDNLTVISDILKSKDINEKFEYYKGLFNEF